jgi:hypothetical protein
MFRVRRPLLSKSGVANELGTEHFKSWVTTEKRATLLTEDTWRWMFDGGILLCENKEEIMQGRECIRRYLPRLLNGLRIKTKNAWP